MSRVWFIVVAVFGLVLMVGSCTSLSKDEVRCGGQQMRPGDKCVVFNDGSRYELSYAEQKASSLRSLKFGVVGGLALAVLGTLLALPLRRPRAPDASAQ